MIRQKIWDPAAASYLLVPCVDQAQRLRGCLDRIEERLKDVPPDKWLSACRDGLEAACDAAEALIEALDPLLQEMIATEGVSITETLAPEVAELRGALIGALTSLRESACIGSEDGEQADNLRSTLDSADRLLDRLDNTLQVINDAIEMYTGALYASPDYLATPTEEGPTPPVF